MSPNSSRLDEDLTDLGVKQFQVLQKKQGFRFSIDAVLLAHFLQPKKHSRIADLGTGCGVIPLLLAAAQPELSIDAFELQPEMAEMASRSMLLNQQQQIQVINADITTLSTAYYQQYDYVYSNPPFFRTGTGKINPLPSIALARHELACTLTQLLQQSSRLLKSNGHLALIHRTERLEEVLTLGRNFHLAPKRLRFIHPRLDLPANLFLLEAVKNGRQALTVDPPLAIYDEEQQYTPEILSYYLNN